jgi:type VI secretion system protein ImpH
MNYLAEVKQEPWRFDFFGVLRRLERSHPDQPRIGDSASHRDEYALLGQDLFMSFPASNLSRFETTQDGRARIFVKFLGLLGPQGALPLATTEEAYGWQLANNDAFPRFLDLLNHRFIQLFFRAWANSRPIAHRDLPERDRFKTYVGAMIGLGEAHFQSLDTVPDDGKLRLAGLMSPQTKSSSRLRRMICDLFGVKAEVDEFIGTRLALEASERTTLGRRNSGLGSEILVGGTCFSVEDKFRIRIFVKDMLQYLRFLPTGDRCEPLADLVYFYIGDQLDWDVELALPAGSVQSTKLGSFGQLGWTTWMAPNWANREAYRCDARFHPADRMRQKRRQAA